MTFQFSLYRVLTYGYELLSQQSEHRSVSWSRSGSGDPQPAQKPMQKRAVRVQRAQTATMLLLMLGDGKKERL